MNAEGNRLLLRMSVTAAGFFLLGFAGFGF
jgi:hypothetical protein